MCYFIKNRHEKGKLKLIEKKKFFEKTLSITGCAALLLYLSTFAFSFSVRKEIGNRVGWECEHCGKSFWDGWLMDASHIDHERNGNYDNPENGECLCLWCHYDYHIDMGDEYGAFLIMQRIESTEGGRTRDWITDNCN